MDDVKGKMKGFMKNLTTSNSKFKGEGRVLGSSSSSSSSTPATNVANSRLLAPVPNAKPKPKPSPIPNPKPSSEFSPFDPMITTSNRSAAGSPAAVFNCPICSDPFPSESAVSDHVDLCLATTNHCADANTKSSSSYVAESVCLYLSNQPPRESVEVVLKLLGNVVREPGNEKFRKIRMGNPKIKEVVGDVKGGVELLESVGFMINVEEGGEIWGTMDAPAEDGVRAIKEAVSLLERRKEGGKKEEEGLASGAEENKVVERKKIDRQVRVYFSVPESVAAKIDVPDSFYNLSMDEVRREAELRKKKMAESQMLIPKSYKEKQATAARKKHKLTVIRIQFPDGVVLQGIFAPSEPTTALYEFVSSTLKQPCLEFELLSPAVAKLRVIPRFTTVGDKRPPTLEEERLVPSALIKFKPIETYSTVFTGLTNELLEASEPLTSNTPIL